MSIAVDVRCLHKSYGAIPVLHDVSFALASGTTLAIIGPNGAGKTTLFRALTGEALPNSGSIVVNGTDMTRLPVASRVHAGIGRTFQVARIYPENTVRDNMVVAIEARRRFRGESLGRMFSTRPLAATIDEAERALTDVGLVERQTLEARFLSHGDKKRLEIAMVLALEPRILMMDEPTAGMSQAERTQTAALIAKVTAERGLTLMLTEHDMDVVFGLADRVMVLNYGRIIALGTVAEVRADPAVREVYLGQEAHGA